MDQKSYMLPNMHGDNGLSESNEDARDAYGVLIAWSFNRNIPRGPLSTRSIMRKLMLLISLAVGLNGAVAFAAPILTFSTGSLTSSGFGSITTSGGNASGFGLVSGFLFEDTGVGNGYGKCSGARLEFDTGIDDNFIRITGSAVGMSPEGFYIPAGTVLVEGVFSDYTINEDDYELTVAGHGSSALCGSLMEALRIPVGTAFSFSFDIFRVNPGYPVGTALTATAVPEPTSLLLLVSGMTMIGLAILCRRRARRCS